MRWLIWTVLVGGLAFGVWSTLQPDYSQVVDFTSRPYDYSALLDLEPHGRFDPEADFKGDYALIYYFSELTCNTCTDRDLVHVANWFQRFGDRVDFLLVVHGQNKMYLKRLKRLGKVNYPILLEEHRGQAGFGASVIALVDKTKGEVIASYHSTSDDTLAPAISKLEEKLESVIHAAASR